MASARSSVIHRFPTPGRRNNPLTKRAAPSPGPPDEWPQRRNAGAPSPEIQRDYCAVLLQQATFSVIAALLWLTPFGPSALRHLTEHPWTHGAAALFLGVVPTAIGYSTWAVAMKSLAPSAAGAFLYLVPAVVLGLAWAFLGELPNAMAVLGGALVLAGVIAVQRLAPPQPVHQPALRQGP
jgi:uncharacterized membrane protein